MHCWRRYFKTSQDHRVGRERFQSATRLRVRPEMEATSLNRHKIVFSAEISERTVHDFLVILEEMREQRAELVTIGMNSNGGNVVAGMLLHNMLKSMPYEV